MKDLLQQVRVRENKEIESGIFLISFLREWDFKSGQCIGIALGKNQPTRLFSICSSPMDQDIQILYHMRGDGGLTSWMARMKRGDILWVTEPCGGFAGTLQPAYWIASGTGVAPFHSMLKSDISMNKYLIHGVHKSSRFFFSDDFENILGNHYIRCADQDEGDGIYQGRVSDYMRQHTELPLDNKYYLCGNFNMVEEVRDLLIERGVAFSNIVSEIHS